MGLLNEARYIVGEYAKGRTPYYTPRAGYFTQPLAPIGRIPTKDKTGESYRDAELRLSAAARAAAGPSAGGGLGGGNAASSLSAGFRPIGGTPEERAQAAETSRIAQLTAQNPELQRYEAARKIAAAQGATPEQAQSAEDIGMQMWAKANSGLAAKVKPGSSGYNAIQSVIGAAAPSALSNDQVLGLMSFDPNTVLSTTQNIQNQFRPNQALTDQEILAAMSFDPNVAMRSAANMAYAPISPAESAMLQEVGGAKGEFITPMPGAGTTTQAGIPLVTPAEQRRKESDAFAQLLQGIRQYGGSY